MKMEIWQCEAQKVGLALEVHFLAADVRVMSRSSDPSMSPGLKLLTKAIVLAMRRLRSAKLASSSA